MDGRISQLRLHRAYTKCTLPPCLPSCRRESFLLAPHRSAKNKTEFARETNYHKVINILRKPHYIATYRLIHKCNEEEPAVGLTTVISK